MTCKTIVCFLVIVLLIDVPSYLAYDCHQCNAFVLNTPVTIDTIPKPDGPTCRIVPGKSGCYVRIGWLDDGTSEVYYSADPALLFDSVIIEIDRTIDLQSKLQIKHRSLGYACQSTAMPCNTPENFKRVLRSTTFPTEQKIQPFDQLIQPLSPFDGNQCSQESNIPVCLTTNITACEQCIGLAEYTNELNICGACPADRAVVNFLRVIAVFMLNNRTRKSFTQIACQQNGACNSRTNLEHIRQSLSFDFDFNTFNRATSSIYTWTSVIMPTIFILMRI
jgi:hypothetical protein